MLFAREQHTIQGGPHVISLDCLDLRRFGMSTESVLAYIRQYREEHLEQLKELLRIPSVSAKLESKPDVERAAKWVGDAISKAGLENVAVMPTGGHPVIYGDWLHAKGAKTILVYGHYDVQPPEPLELWESPPFSPTIRDGKLYARGATDDKGQMFCHIKAVQAHLQTRKRLPVNVKFLVEGEEEVGSENLDRFIEEHKSMLRADVVLISDSAMWDKQHPSIVYSLRGLAYFQVDARGARSDLHSGSFGGAAPNAVEWLAKLLASVKDPRTGRVLMRGFYDDVTLTKPERRALGKLPFNEREYKKGLGLRSLYVEKGFSVVEATTIRPTFEVNGLWGGYTGEGQKTVLPNEAHAKISMRLVANQDPNKIGKSFKSFVRNFERKSPGITFKVKQTATSWPAKIPITHPAVVAGKKALEKAFGGRVVFSGEGGSIPVVSTFERVIKAPSVLMGFGLHDENLHAPNEHIRVHNFYRGIEASALFFEEVSSLKPVRKAIDEKLS